MEREISRTAAAHHQVTRRWAAHIAHRVARERNPGPRTAQTPLRSDEPCRSTRWGQRGGPGVPTKLPRVDATHAQKPADLGDETEGKNQSCCNAKNEDSERNQVC